MIKIVLIGLFFLGPCTAQHGLFGTWKAGDYSLWEKGIALLHGRDLEMHTELVLKPDFSFRLEGSCEVFEGKKWTVELDSLFLFPDTCWMKDKTATGFVKGGYKAYKVKKNKLEKLHQAYYNEVGKGDSLTRHPVELFEILKPVK